MTVVAAAVAVMAVQANADTKFSGFVDAQYNYRGNQGVNGFAVHDGALYVDSDMDVASMKLDIPISAGTATYGMGTSGLNIGNGKAQAYVHRKYDFGLSWKVGQFDDNWGFENNDSVGVFFARGGRINSAVPRGYAGVNFGYSFGDSLTLNVQMANDSTGATAAVAGTNYAYTGQLTYKMDSFWLKGGYEMQAGAVGTTKNNTVLDIAVGAKAGNFDINVVFDMVDKVAWAESGMAFGGEFIYNLDDTSGLGLRAEYLSKITNNSQIEATLGYRRYVTKALATKVGYTYTSTTAVAGGTAGTQHGLDLAAVYAF